MKSGGYEAEPIPLADPGGSGMFGRADRSIVRSTNRAGGSLTGAKSGEPPS